jgi:hypothetical protein
MGAHWAYVEWSPEHEGVHDVEVEGEHTHKACRAKSEPLAVSVECDVILPDVIRHAVSAESEARVMAMARIFGLAEVPYGVPWSAVYIGEVASA